MIGILILIDAADPAVRIGLKTAILAGLPFALIFTILLVALFRSLNQKVSTGNEGMVGLTGIADNDIDAKGRVRIRGEYWTACSDSPIPAGRPVKVVGVDNLTLRVEEVRS